jgi:LPS-assembly lipoprotein
MIARRGLLRIGGLGIVSLAGGCGFHPLYAPGGARQAALQAVYVNIIANRPGQVLRQALQSRLEGSDDAVAKRYTLSVQYAEALETVNVQADNSATRARDVARATWTLYPLANETQKLASGTVRSVDGYNIIDEQYFYMDLSLEATQRRQADALADQIVTGLAVYFTKHPEA